MERKRLEILLLYAGVLVPFLLTLPVIDRYFAFIASMFFLLTLLLQIKEKYFPSFLVNTLAFLFVLIYLFTVNLGNFLPAGITTILFLLCIKLLEVRSLRNIFQVYLLAFLLFAGLTLFYIHLYFFALLVLNLLYFPTALFVHLYLEEGQLDYIGPAELRSGILSMTLILMATIGVSLVFFVFFPRLGQPLFQIGISERKAKTGFTDSIRLGEVSEIQESSTKVLRIELATPINPSRLYLRVITYDYFDGKTWKRKSLPYHLRSPLLPGGATLSGTVYLELPQGDFLPVVESPVMVKSNFPVFSHQDYTFQTDGVPTYPLKYAFVSMFSSEKQALEADLSPYLQLPKLSMEVQKLGKSLQGADPQETIKNIHQYLTSPPFTYSNKKLPLSARPMEEFLLKVKRGNCEYFAGAMVVLLRLNGIPARVVGGYRGAIYQRLGNYHVVEERFAHAWVEAYVDGKWFLLDPTPPQGVLPFEKTSPFKKIFLWIDLLNYYYAKLILDYDLRRQRKLLSLGKEIFKSQRFKGLSDLKIPTFFAKSSFLLLIFVAVLVLLSVTLLYLVLKRFLFYLQPKERRLLKEFLKELKKLGYERSPSQGLNELAERMKEQSLKELAIEFVKIYQSCYYKDKKFSGEDLQKLASILEKLKERGKKEGQFLRQTG